MSRRMRVGSSPSQCDTPRLETGPVGGHTPGEILDPTHRRAGTDREEAPHGGPAILNEVIVPSFVPGLFGAILFFSLQAPPPGLAQSPAPEIARIVDGVREAYGGSQALSKVRSFRLEGRLEALTRNQSGVFERSLGPDGRFTSIIRYPDRSEVRVADAAGVWSGPALDSVTRAQGLLASAIRLQAARARLPWSLLEMGASLTPSPADEGGIWLTGELAPGEGLRFRVDTVTGRVVRSEAWVAVGATRVEFATEYGDFRKVDGVLFPFHEETWASGIHTATQWLERATLNPGTAGVGRTVDPVGPPEALRGRVLLGDTVLRSGEVVLHLMAGSNVQVDTVELARDGTFTLPGARPRPGTSDVFFASVLYAGVLHLGPQRRSAELLLDPYEIRVFDARVAPAGGVGLALSVRSLVFRPRGAAWEVTDLIKVNVEGDQAIVPGPDGVAWAYPLPPGARNVQVEDTDFAGRAADVQDGHLRVTAALPPGEQALVARYLMESPRVELPLPGITGSVHVLFQEPAPSLAIPGLDIVDQVEIEPGSTYRHFAASDLRDASLSVVPGDDPTPTLPLGAFAALCAVVLTVVGGWSAGVGGARHGSGSNRSETLLALARLDEAMEGRADCPPEEHEAYLARRANLLKRLGPMRGAVSR
jgi:hypothetical protein